MRNAELVSSCTSLLWGSRKSEAFAGGGRSAPIAAAPHPKTFAQPREGLSTSPQEGGALSSRQSGYTLMELLVV
ncbi:MAG TPA: hypothetical protein VHU87_02620, partial [Rhizomicrobium sp.]|nr:hypothetical protein [Rhizomicrobium sp.]